MYLCDKNYGIQSYHLPKDITLKPEAFEGYHHPLNQKHFHSEESRSLDRNKKHSTNRRPKVTLHSNGQALTPRLNNTLLRTLPVMLLLYEH